MMRHITENLPDEVYETMQPTMISSTKIIDSSGNSSTTDRISWVADTSAGTYDAMWGTHTGPYLLEVLRLQGSSFEGLVMLL